MSGQRSLEEGEESKRRSRNLSEKKRRDEFNSLISELSLSLSSSPRKMDKSSVLKGTIGFLKTHYEVSVQGKKDENRISDWKPSFLSHEEFTFLMLEALDGFLMVLSSRGKILYVSQTVSSLLGHFQLDLLGKSIYDFVQSEDKRSLQDLLDQISVEIPKDETPSLTQTILINIRSGDESRGVYELINLTGYRKQWIPTECPGPGMDEKTVFVSTGRVLESPLLPTMATLSPSTQTEFSSRHSLEWKFLFLDQRAPRIIGYLPFELLGTSGYDYYHVDDLQELARTHERLMEVGEETSDSYRFLTKGQQWIWLQSHYSITYHQWNSKPEFILGTHRVVRNGEVRKVHSPPSRVPKLESPLPTDGEEEREPIPLVLMERKRGHGGDPTHQVELGLRVLS